MLLGEFKITNFISTKIEGKLKKFLFNYINRAFWLIIECRTNINYLQFGLKILYDVTEFLKEFPIYKKVKTILVMDTKKDYDQLFNVSLKLYDQEPEITDQLILD